MATFGEKLRLIRRERGMSQEELAELIGTSKQVISRYENNLRTPKVSVAQKYAEKLHVSLDFLVNEKIPAAKNIIPLPEMRKIPLLGTIACGTPILAEENIEENIDIPSNIRADFALRCKGDSMTGAEIYDGDIVYIKQQDTVDNGQIAAVLIEDEATLKRFFYDQKAGVLMLSAENPDFPPLIYQGETLDHVRILGRAVGLTRTL